MAPTTTCSCPCCCFAPTTTADRSSQGPTRLLSNDFGIKRPTTFRHSSRESVSTGCPPDTSGRGNPLYVAISCRLRKTDCDENEQCSHCHFTFAFSPGGERANLILSKRARLRTASGVRLSRVAIAAVLSPAAPIDRSSPSFSGVHGGPGAVISSPSTPARPFAYAPPIGIGDFLASKPLSV